MTDATLVLIMKDGRKLNLQVAPNDWDGQKELAEEVLHLMHKQMGGKDDELPSDEIIVVDYLLRHLHGAVKRYDAKLDELIAENNELREQMGRERDAQTGDGEKTAGDPQGDIAP
jgi:hypothetical protein